MTETVDKIKSLRIVVTDFDDVKNTLLSGGQARATFEISKRLVALGHQVTVLCSRFPSSHDGYNQGIYYKHIGLGSKNIKLNNFVYFFALLIAISKVKADIVVECFTAPVSTCFTPLFTKVPVIGMPTMFEAKEFSKKYHLPFHWVEAVGCRLYKYFLAYSPLTKAKMEKLNARVVSRIIPNGVSEEFFSTPTTRGDYALFIGRIDLVQKGLDLLLSAIAEHCHELPINFIIAGNGSKEDEAKLQQLIIDKKIEQQVKFVGRVDGQAKLDLLANARFGVYPSRFEDFPLVPLEFTALNKPLVTFDIPGLSWLNATVAMKAQSFSTDALGAALVKLSTDDELLTHMERACRPFAQQYDWDSLVQDYLRFFNEILEIEKRSLHRQHTGKRVLILGGAGFIGSALADYLHEQGDSVTIFDNLLYENAPRSFAPHQFIKGDIRQAAALEKAIAATDCVVNLAALSNDPASDLDPQLAWEINYLANKNIAEICQRLGKRVIFASSCSVYGFTEKGTFAETSPLNPITLYAKTKVLSEDFYTTNDIDGVVLRFATVYGYSKKPRFDLVVNTMIGKAYFDKKIMVNGGNQWRPLIHVKDVARAIYVAAHQSQLAKRIYNIGSNEQNFQISELATLIAKNFPGVVVEQLADSVDCRSYKVDFDQLANDYDFKTLYTITDAVREFDEAFRRGTVTTMEEDMYYRVKYLKNHLTIKALDNFHQPAIPAQFLPEYEN